MKMTRTLELMKIERECVKRQDGTECPRNVDPVRGCYGCDLCQYGEEILEAYDEVINHYECMINSIETFMKYCKEGDQA
jgi:hypothetical protein